MLNILSGSILENEQDGEPVILRDSGECVTDGEWTHHLLLEDPIGSMPHSNSAHSWLKARKKVGRWVVDGPLVAE